MLHHPCILGDPLEKEINQSRPKRGRKCYITPTFSGVPNKGDKIKAGPKEGKNATSALHSRGSPNKWEQNQNWLPKPCLLGAHKWAEMLRQPCILGDPQTNGDKIRIGCLNPAFWGPTSGRKCYVNLAFSGVPNKGDKIKAGPKEGKNATSALHSRGSPNKWRQNQNWLPKPCLLGAHKWAEMLRQPCILGGPQQRGQNQSGPKRGQKCYISPAFSGIPKQMATKSELAA